MLGKNNIRRFYGASLATVFAGLLVGGLPESWLKLHTARILVAFVMLWVGLYFVGVAILERGDELNRRIPINSKELLRRKKVFFDWLASQARR